MDNILMEKKKYRKENNKIGTDRVLSKGVQMDGIV